MEVLERDGVLDLVHEERRVDRPPAETRDDVFGGGEPPPTDKPPGGLWRERQADEQEGGEDPLDGAGA